MASGRDVHHAARRTVPAVVRGGQAWRRVRIPVQCGATRPGPNASESVCCTQAPCCARSSPINCAACSRKRRDPGACKREARVRQSSCQNERLSGEQSPTAARTRASHGGFREPKCTQKFLSCFALKQHLIRSALYCRQLEARSLHGVNSPNSPQNPSTSF